MCSVLCWLLLGLPFLQLGRSKMKKNPDRIERKGFKLTPRRPRGMRLYSVVVLGPKVREVLNCQKRTKLEAIDHGKEFVDGWVAFKERVGRS